MEGRFYRTDGWRLNKTPGADSFLENKKGGRIALDTTVERVLESINDVTIKEILGQESNCVSRRLLEIIFTVFIRLEIIRDKNYTVGPAESKPVPVEDLEHRPLVSVVIVNYNGDKHLEGLLGSLENQSYSNREIVIIDNASTDGSCKWIRENYPGVRLFALKKNIGFAAAVNRGIKESKGEYILVLNNDIELDRAAIHELVKVAQASEGPWSAIAPKMKFLNNPAFINAIGNSLYPISWGSDNFIGSIDFGQFDDFEGPFSACFGAVLLNAAVLDEIGLLESRYKFYYEDMDWSYRAQLLGYPILTAPRSEIYHKFGASMGMKSHAFKLKYIVGNRLYFVLKNLEYGTIKRYLLNYLIEDIKSSLIYLKRGNFPFVWAYKRGFLRLFLSLPGLLFKRWRLQKRRKLSDSGIFSKVAPLNLTLMEGGIPRLDVFSLRTNYGFLADYNGDACENTEKEKRITDGEHGLSYRGRPEGARQVVWRLRPPRKNREAEEKIFMEFSFRVEEDGYFDIHLLGIMRRGVTVYLDGEVISDGTGGIGKLSMFCLAGKDIYIAKGRHTIEMERRCHVNAVVIKESKSKDKDKGKGKELRVKS